MSTGDQVIGQIGPEFAAGEVGQAADRVQLFVSGPRRDDAVHLNGGASRPRRPQEEVAACLVSFSFTAVAPLPMRVRR